MVAGNSGAFELLPGGREELHLVVDRTPPRELRLGTGRSRRAPASSLGGRGLLLDVLPLFDGHPAPFGGLVVLGLLFALPWRQPFGCDLAARSGVFFVARYAGDGLAPSPL
jgi:hypothetical protein